MNNRHYEILITNIVNKDFSEAEVESLLAQFLREITSMDNSFPVTANRDVESMKLTIQANPTTSGSWTGKCSMDGKTLQIEGYCQKA